MYIIMLILNIDISNSALRLEFPKLPASLNCQFLICLSVFSNVYCLLYDILDISMFKINIIIYCGISIDGIYKSNYHISYDLENPDISECAVV
jgi:hypothetical protein